MKLVMVKPKDVGQYAYAPRASDMNNAAIGLAGYPFVNDHESVIDPECITSWYVEDHDVEQFCSWLTGLHPGKEVEVYSLEQVFSRSVGELKSKSVTKEGILPT